MTEEDAANVQASDLGHATKDLYEAVERGEHPEWELLVQIMDDHEHPELDFDPLDDTKTWPEQEFPLEAGRPDGAQTAMSDNYFTENEQISFGTGVLVDGLDFSDDKMLVGRTFSYSDTQRHRVGPELPAAPRQPGQERGGAHQPARRPDDVPRGRRRARTPTSTTSRRSPEGCARTSIRHTTSRARRSAAGSPASGSRAPTTTSRRASATADGGLGARRPGGRTSPTCSPSATAPVQERMVWHFLLVRERPRPAGRRGPRHHAGGRRRTWSRWSGQDPHRRGPQAAGEPRRQPAARRRRGSRMTHCVPDERAQPASGG